MIIEKNDFIEIEFTGKANNEIFDTTKEKEAKEKGIQTEVKPLIISAGNSMILKGFDDFIIGKEINKDYLVKLTPEQAFGKRIPSLVKTLPMKVFLEKNIKPYPGLILQMDNYVAKILSVSGGRVITDFNNPLAGKEVEYQFKILRKIEDNSEKVKSLIHYFLKQDLNFEIKGDKVILKKPELKPFIQVCAPKFKEMTGLNFEVEDLKKEKEENKTADKNGSWDSCS